MSSQIATRTSSRKERNGMEVDGRGWTWMEATRETWQLRFAWFFRERPDDLRKTIEEPFNLSTFLGPSEKPSVVLGHWSTDIGSWWKEKKRIQRLSCAGWWESVSDSACLKHSIAPVYLSFGHIWLCFFYFRNKSNHHTCACVNTCGRPSLWHSLNSPPMRYFGIPW